MLVLESRTVTRNQRAQRSEGSRGPGDLQTTPDDLQQRDRIGNRSISLSD